MAKGTGLVNKGNIYITSTSPPGVYEAYLEQFQQDFHAFLKSRAKELVQGGGMILTFVGRDETREIITPWGLIGLALNDMVSEVHRQDKPSLNKIPSYSLIFFVSYNFLRNHN